MILYNWKWEEKSDRGDLHFWPKQTNRDQISPPAWKKKQKQKNTGLNIWNNIFKTLCGHQVLKDNDPKELGNASILFFPELSAFNELICLRTDKETTSKVQHILWVEDTELSEGTKMARVSKMEYWRGKCYVEEEFKRSVVGLLVCSAVYWSQLCKKISPSQGKNQPKRITENNISTHSGPGILLVSTSQTEKSHNS